MDRRGNFLLDAVVMFAMFVTATAFAAALIVHAKIGALPAVIAGAAFLMVMITSHILLTRFAQGGDAERMDDFEQALEIIDGDLQRIDKVEDDVARLDLLTDKIEQFDKTLSSFEASNLSRLSSDMETLQTRLETLRTELEVETRSQREELNTELRLLERLMKQLSIDLAASEGDDRESAGSASAETPEEDLGTVAQDYEPIEFLENDETAEAAPEDAAEATAGPDETSAVEEDGTSGEEEVEPIDMTAMAEPERHEAGAWQSDWRGDEGVPFEGEAASSRDDDAAEEAEPAQELADEELPPEDTGETVAEEGEKLAVSTAETEQEEAAILGGEDDWPAQGEPEMEPSQAPEPGSEPVSEPEPVPAEEAAPEESELVEADLGRVEAAEIEAEQDVDGSAEEPETDTHAEEDRPGDDEEDEIVLTELVMAAPEAERAEAGESLASAFSEETAVSENDEDSAPAGDENATADTEESDRGSDNGQDDRKS